MDGITGAKDDLLSRKLLIPSANLLPDKAVHHGLFLSFLPNQFPNKALKS